MAVRAPPIADGPQLTARERRVFRAAGRWRHSQVIPADALFMSRRFFTSVIALVAIRAAPLLLFGSYFFSRNWLPAPSHSILAMNGQDGTNMHICTLRNTHWLAFGFFQIMSRTKYVLGADLVTRSNDGHDHRGDRCDEQASSRRRLH